MNPFIDETPEKRGLIYVLRLENDCWYVGWTNDPKRRRNKHFYRPNIKWLQDNPAIEVAYQFYGVFRDETLATLELAHAYGIDKVRGGVYAKNHKYKQENLPMPERTVLHGFFDK